MEAVKEERELVWGDGGPQIADGGVRLAVLFGDLDRDGGPLGGKFGGVVQQVVAHLGHRIRVAPHLQGLVRHFNVHIQVTSGDLALQADQYLGDGLREVELLLSGDVLRQSIEAGQVQHPPHQPGQAAGL